MHSMPPASKPHQLPSEVAPHTETTPPTGLTNPTLTWYHWDSPIGHLIACAESVELARNRILSTLGEYDAARADVVSALIPEPTTLGDKPFAVIAWHQ